MKIFQFFFFFTLIVNAQNYHYVVDSAQTIEEQYYLEKKSRTSAGVYKGDVLIRTLWSNVEKDKGNYTVEWDGVDDKGSFVEAGSYVIKVLSNNVEYEWEGAKIGNTSANLTGENRYHGLSGFFKFVVVNDMIYWSNGYNEQRTAANKTSIYNTQVTSPVLDKGAIVKYICADESYIYWSAHDVHSNNSFVFVTIIENDEEYNYTKATNLEVSYGRTYSSALNIINGEDSYITGIAKSGNYLFIARQLQNTIDVLDMDLGGDLVHTITSINAPRELMTDINGGLWIITDEKKVSLYQILPDGSLGQISRQLENLEEPLTIGLNPNNNEIAVCDGGQRQQVRFFNSENGQETEALGDLGGYLNDPKASNFKFYFSDLKSKKFNSDIYTTQENHASISYQNDGSFWVLDRGNNRMMHYGQNKNFIKKIQYIPDWLMLSVDKNNASRLFIDYLEFEIDYSEDEIDKSWKLKNNWGSKVTDENDNSFGRIREPVTLSNGKTYFLLTEGFNFVIAELAENGVRVTDKVLEGFNWIWLANGTLVYANSAELGKEVIWEKYELSGFDVNNDPIFNNGSILAKRSNVRQDEPLFRYGGWLSVALIDNNKLVTFDGRPEENGMGGGYHLGLLDTNSNDWLFQTSDATGVNYNGDYPLDGRFDTGNKVHNAGSKAMVFGKNILWGYYGEFWKGGFQTNQYAHYWENGLLVNVFGTNWTKNTNGLEVTKNGGAVFTPFEGMAGNAISPNSVAHPTDLDIGYLYHSDESWHSGIHRWKISGLNSIKEHTLHISF